MIKAIIFDMDGVLVNNFYIHLEAWIIFCNRHNIILTEETLKQHAFGRTNEELMPFFFNRNMDQKEIDILSEEKENIYRNLYKGRVSLTEGLHDFLISLKKNGYIIAVGTSAPPKNADFILSETHTEEFFSMVINGSMVRKGKPEPDIYLLTAKKLGMDPTECLVFEDSFAGIEAARRANMKVIGVATTHSKEKLKNCDKVIENFTEITVKDLQSL